MVSCCIAGESLVASGRVPQDIGKVHYVPVVCTLPYDINAGTSARRELHSCA